MTIFVEVFKKKKAAEVYKACKIWHFIRENVGSVWVSANEVH